LIQLSACKGIVNAMVRQMLSNLGAGIDEEVKFAYLFGSQATGDTTALSDVDIAVYLDDEVNDLDKHLEIHHTLSKQLKKNVDLIVLNNLKNFNLLENILTEGRVIVDRDTDFRKIFEVEKQHQILGYKAFKRYLDVAWNRKEDKANRECSGYSGRFEAEL